MRNQQDVRGQARFVDLAIDGDEGGDVDEEGGVGAAPPADPSAEPEAAPPKGVAKGRSVTLPKELASKKCATAVRDDDGRSFQCAVVLHQLDKDG